MNIIEAGLQMEAYLKTPEGQEFRKEAEERYQRRIEKTKESLDKLIKE